MLVEVYQYFQKFVELGYHFCDTFLSREKGENIYKGYVPSIHNPVLDSIFFMDNGITREIPPEWDFEGYSIYGDISSDNIGIANKANNDSVLFTDEKFLIVDTGDIIHCLYNDLQTVEFCIGNFYIDSLFQDAEYMLAKAVTYGYRMRMGLLGDLVFFNVLAQTGFHLYISNIPKERIEISDENIICMRVIANFIKRYFDKRGLCFEKCSIDIVNTYQKLLEEEFSPFLILQMMRYLGQYSMVSALCTGNILNLFVALQIVFVYAVETKNSLLAMWSFNQLSHSPYSDERVISIMKDKMNRLAGISELKDNVEVEWYAFFWQNYELGMNSINYKKYEETDEELLIAAAIICKKDEVASIEIQEMLSEVKDDSVLELFRSFLMN